MCPRYCVRTIIGIIKILVPKTRLTTNWLYNEWVILYLHLPSPSITKIDCRNFHVNDIANFTI